MDITTLAMAKQYTNSQRLAYTEGGGSLTWDGNTEGLPSVLGAWYRVSDKVYDARTVNAVYFSNGQVLIPSTDNIVDVLGDGTFFVIGNYAIFVSVAQEYGDFGYCDVGTYFFAGEAKYVSSITFKETIHHIDPKFLPGVCLSVLDISDVTIKSGEGLYLSAEHHAMFVELATKRQPFILCARFGTDDYTDIISGVPVVTFYSDDSDTEIFASLEVKIPGTTLETRTLVVFAFNEDAAAALYVNGSLDWAE